MFNALVDTRLSVRVGDPGDAERTRISEQLNRALRSTLGDILGDDPIEVETVDRLAPWARDLARGMHWHAVHGRSPGAAVDAYSIFDELADDELHAELRDEGVATVAMTWALTHDRIVDQIHGHQAHKRYSAHALQQRWPWQGDVILGYSIHLVLEWLRLDPRLHRPSCPGEPNP